MPLGDPMGGNETYLEKGNVRRVWMATVPVSDLDRAIDFYVDVLGLKLFLVEKEARWAEVGTDEPMAKLGLHVPDAGESIRPGVKTGVALEVDSIFEFHRRLVDEEVVFVVKPEKRRWGGLMASFLDPDGNELMAVEDPEHYSRGPQPTRPRRQKVSEVKRSCRRKPCP